MLTAPVVVLQLSDWTGTLRFRIVLLPGGFGKSQESFSRRVKLTCYRYQMLDAFAGLFYTLVTTLAILFSLKAVWSVIRGKWAPVCKDTNKTKRWKLEASIQHSWKES